MELKGDIWLETGTVAAGTSKTIDLPTGGELSLNVAPGSGGAVLAEYSLGSIWISFGNAASAPAGYSRQAPTTRLRITATTADATYELAQENG